MNKHILIKELYEVGCLMYCPYCSCENSIDEKLCKKCGAQLPILQQQANKFCSKCGTSIHLEAVICPKCGCLVEPAIKLKKVTDRKVNIELFRIFILFIIIVTLFLNIVTYIQSYIDDGYYGIPVMFGIYIIPLVGLFVLLVLNNNKPKVVFVLSGIIIFGLFITYVFLSFAGYLYAYSTKFLILSISLLVLSCLLSCGYSICLNRQLDKNSK